MPGSSSNMDYFFRKLPSLRSEQKVAAVNLGIFPDAGVQVASSQPPVTMDAVKVIQRNPTTRSDEVDEDRIGSIERWLSQATQGNATLPQQVVPQPPQQVASASIPTIAARQELRSSGTTYASRKLWIQLASGPNAAALPEQFSRMRERNNKLFEGIRGYVFEEPGRARLLIGPFRNSDEANIFADDLAQVRIDAFTWTSQVGQTIRKLPSE